MLGLVLFCGIFVLWSLMELVRYPPVFLGVDFSAWGGDYRIAKSCLAGDGCAFSKFPLAYLINSALATVFGGERVLLWLNMSFLMLPLVAFWSGNARVFWFRTVVYLLAILLSPLPFFYVNSGGLELQGGIVLGTALALFCGRYFFEQRCRFLFVVMCATWSLAPMYKDVNLVVSALAVIVSIVIGCRAGGFAGSERVSSLIRKNWREFAIVFFCVCMSLLASFLYNYIRYDSVRPVAYIHEAEYTTQSVGWVFFHVVATVFSPNGGLLVFWGSAASFVYVLWRIVGARTGGASAVIAITVTAAAIVFLSFWWTPFGWEYWGNRLILPFIVASFIVLNSSVKFSSPVSSSPVNGRCFFILLAALFVVSSFYVGVAASGDRMKYLDDSLWSSNACKSMLEARERKGWGYKNSPIYKACHRDRFFSFPPLFLADSIVSYAEPGREYLFRNGGNGERFLSSGWSVPEEWGVWSEGGEATLRMAVPSSSSGVLFKARAFVGESHPVQRVRVYVNGSFVRQVELRSEGDFSVDFPSGIGGRRDDVVVRFVLFDAVSPTWVSFGEDRRVLAIGLTSAVLY